MIDEEIQALRAQVAPDLFEGSSRATFAATSLPALALRWALFEEGRNIAEPAVLGDIARQFDVTWSEGDAAGRVLDEWSDGVHREVIGSPHFFVSGEGWFCPVLDISHDGGDLRVSESAAALDSLLERAAVS